MMKINLKKILSVGLAAALATTMSVGFADNDDDDDDEGPKNRHRVEKTFEPSVDREESIVISLATDPREPEGDSDPVGNSEPACVAVQIGMNLLMANVGEEVTPADNVTLFATLDGVYLVAPDTVDDISATWCRASGGEKTLSELLEMFDSLGGEVLICPLCWAEREYTVDPDDDEDDPTYGEVANPVSLHNLFLYADKVLTF